MTFLLLGMESILYKSLYSLYSVFFLHYEYLVKILLDNTLKENSQYSLYHNISRYHEFHIVQKSVQFIQCFLYYEYLMKLLLDNTLKKSSPVQHIVQKYVQFGQCFLKCEYLVKVILNCTLKKSSPIQLVP